MPYFKRRGQKASYEVATGRFQPEVLDSLSRQVYDVLREIGAIAVCCSYNGGGDEGFAYLDEVVLGDKKLGVNELKQQLSDSSLGDVPSSWGFPENGDMYVQIAEILHGQYERLSSPNRVQDRLDRFARTLAGYLLGNNYGVGEVSMIGWFQADLITGEITDMRRKDRMRDDQ